MRKPTAVRADLAALKLRRKELGAELRAAVKEQYRLIVEAFDEGGTSTQIASAMELDEPYVRNVLARNKRSRRNHVARTMTTAQKAIYERCRRQGVSWRVAAQIATAPA